MNKKPAPAPSARRCDFIDVFERVLNEGVRLDTTDGASEPRDADGRKPRHVSVTHIDAVNVHTGSSWRLRREYVPRTRLTKT